MALNRWGLFTTALVTLSVLPGNEALRNRLVKPLINQSVSEANTSKFDQGKHVSSLSKKTSVLHNEKAAGDAIHQALTFLSHQAQFEKVEAALLTNMTLGLAFTILEKTNKSFSIGVTTGLIKTLREHLGLVAGSKHLRSNQPAPGDADRAAGAATGATESALTMLNGLVLQAIEKLDVEIVRCDSVERTNLAVLQGIRDDVITFSAMVAGAATSMNKAKGDVGRFEQLNTDTKGEFDMHSLTCWREIEDLQNKLAIATGDMQVMGTVVALSDCGDGAEPSAATLMQCVDPHTNASWTEMRPGSPQMQKEIAKVRDPRVKAILQNPNIFLEDAQDPVSAGAIAGAKCTLGSSPSCPKIREKFTNLAGTVLDSHMELKMMLKNLEDHCETTTEVMTKQIQNYDNILAEANEKLTGATKDWNTFSGQKSQKQAENTDTEKEHTDAMTGCKVNIENLASEKCALKKIRGELLKMDKLPSDLTDCTVDVWTEDACSVSCGGGTQVLTRSMTPGKGGAACPVGKAEQSCKEDRCPIDCLMEEWSEWGSCTALCGGGIKERNRGITTPAVTNQAKQCGETSETVACNVGSCNEVCELGDWSGWSATCSRPCGGGQAIQRKDVIAPARGTGTCPGFYDEARYAPQPCNTQACPETPTPMSCHSKLDVVLVVDGSGSMSKEGWDAVKNGTATLAKSLVGDVRTSVLLFSGPKSFMLIRRCLGQIDEMAAGAETVPLDPEKDCGMEWQSRFADYKDPEQVAAVAEKMAWPQATTLTSMALVEASAELGNGRADAQGIVIVLTDGYPMSQLEASKQAESLRKRARLMFVPMGDKVMDPGVFNAWASAPAKDNVVSLSDFGELSATGTVNKLVLDFCPDVRYGNKTLDDLVKEAAAAQPMLSIG